MAEKIINAVGAAIIEDGKVFLAKDENVEGFIFPYGKYDAEEGIIESLKESMKEKYGVDIEVTGFIHTGEQALDNGDTLVLTVYTADVKDGKLPEGDEYTWISTDDLTEADLAPVCELIAVRVRNEFA